MRPDVSERVTQLRRLEDHRREGGTLVPGELLYGTHGVELMFHPTIELMLKNGFVKQRRQKN